MFVKLEPQIVEILCCPFCKDGLLKSPSGFACGGCGLFYPLTTVVIGAGHTEGVYDFRLHKPPYCIPQGEVLWQETQNNYENFNDEFGGRDSLKEYLDEIDSVKEIYTEEFLIGGRVLDVGGHQGRLRHFLGKNVDLYISIDPHLEVFRGLDQQPNLLKAYPCLSEPCNFLAANAEHLPFRSKSFDWVHMRSVVDHFSDPYRAFLEAYRVSKAGGKLLIGLAILDRIKDVVKETTFFDSSTDDEKSTAQSNPSPLVRIYMKWKLGGWRGLFQAARGRIFSIPNRTNEIHDDHMFRFTLENLMDLMEKTGWPIVKQRWQKSPYYYCIYALGEARPWKP
jgi:SAM-dependent methyltransferase